MYSKNEQKPKRSDTFPIRTKKTFGVRGGKRVTVSSIMEWFSFILETAFVL